jgi:hypothetical protein
VAYDPERGRLWGICEACGGWTLAPIAERWEILEELERLVTSNKRRAQLAGKTANVALFKAGKGDIIRIGKTGLSEEAAWRYGEAHAVRKRGPNPFAPRRLRLGEWMLGSASAFRSTMAGRYGAWNREAIRKWVRFGDIAWRGDEACAACGARTRSLTFFECRTLILREGGEDGMTPSLVRACPRCRDEDTGGLQLEGTAAEVVLRRVLAQQQDRGVPESHLNAAMHLIELGGGASGISSILARYGRYLGELPITSAVALRVLANDAYERRMLDLEAAFVEQQWRREEELASIIDGDLTDIPSLEGMRRDMRRML